MAFRLLSLLISLVLMGLLASTMAKRLNSSHATGPATPETLLRESGMVVERTHEMTGTYEGVALQGDSLRLVSSDASGYCLQLTWVNRQLYHLRGPGGKPAPGGC